MKVNTTKKYQSKLLIFGEHAILKGSQALAMPLPVFYGHWAYSADVAKQLNLGDFADYLNQHFPGFFDISALQKELRQ